MSKYASFGPFVITEVEVVRGGGHGGHGRVVVRRRGFEPMTLWMEPDEAEALRPLRASISDANDALYNREGPALPLKFMLSLTPPEGF